MKSIKILIIYIRYYNRCRNIRELIREFSLHRSYKLFVPGPHHMTAQHSTFISSRAMTFPPHPLTPVSSYPSTLGLMPHSQDIGVFSYWECLPAPRPNVRMPQSPPTSTMLSHHGTRLPIKAFSQVSPTFPIPVFQIRSVR